MVLKWGGIALAAAWVIFPVVLVASATRESNEKRKEGEARLEQGKAELARIEALDRVRSDKIEAAKSLSPGTDACLVAPKVAMPPLKQGSDLDGQFWRHYMEELTSSDSPFELRGSVTMIGLTKAPGGPRVRKLRSTVSMIESNLSQGSVRDESPELPLATDWQRDVTIIVERVKNPHMLPGTREFEAGYASGTAFLFDYERGDVVCVGHFGATNADTFEAEFRKEGGMDFTSGVHHDLEARTIVAAVRSLRAVSSPSR